MDARSLAALLNCPVGQPALNDFKSVNQSFRAVYTSQVNEYVHSCHIKYFEWSLELESTMLLACEVSTCWAEIYTENEGEMSRRLNKHLLWRIGWWYSWSR